MPQAWGVSGHPDELDDTIMLDVSGDNRMQEDDNFSSLQIPLATWPSGVANHAPSSIRSAHSHVGQAEEPALEGHVDDLQFNNAALHNSERLRSDACDGAITQFLDDPGDLDLDCAPSGVEWTDGVSHKFHSDVEMTSLENTLSHAETNQASFSLQTEALQQTSERIRDSRPPGTGKNNPKFHRTKISSSVRLVLEEHFNNDPYPTDGELALLSGKVGLTARSIKNWFSNTRSRKDMPRCKLITFLLTIRNIHVWKHSHLKAK